MQEVRDRHRWVGAATIPVTEQAAGTAHRRGTLRLAEQTIEVLELYCGDCRRPFEQARQQPCVIGYHLIGGDPNQKRAPRKHRGGLVQPDGSVAATA
jgi:hypothetical protein